MKFSDDGLRVVSPVPREVWESLLRSDRGAAMTQSLAWRDAVFASGRYRDVSLLYEFGSGRQVVLPLARRRGQPPLAAVVASWPQEWSVGGPICSDGRVSLAEAAAVLTDVAQRGPLEARVTLRYNADRAWLEAAAGQFEVSRYGCYVLDLDGGFEHVWQYKFRRVARKAVRKAERSGLDVEVDRSGRLVGVVRELYEKWIRARAARQGQPVWLTRMRMSRIAPTSLPHMKLVAEHFGKDCATWVARSKGQPVAAMIVLRFGTYVQPWRLAEDGDLAHPVAASEYLHRLNIEEACRDGYRFYNMGGSPEGSSLARYKEKFGASMYFTHELSLTHPPLRAARTAWRLSEDLVKKTLRMHEA
jgi:GNAT acetyltransferase-like protein